MLLAQSKLREILYCHYRVIKYPTPLPPPKKRKKLLENKLYTTDKRSKEMVEFLFVF